MRIDLQPLPQGQMYEDRYQGFIKIFERIALTPATEKVQVYNAPWSWYPLLHHLNCDLQDCRSVFNHCDIVRAAIMQGIHSFDRTMLEVLCSFRPEMADCLWKVDMQWKVRPGRVREYQPIQEFIVTTNGSYHRREIINYMEKLRAYVPTKRKVLLVPCAADKPYPSPMHLACLDLMPRDFYMANATGVVGLVPQDLWNDMPWYDSGIPNQWRLYEVVKEYFSKHSHTDVVVYCDFYSSVIQDAFGAIRQTAKVRYVLPPGRYDDYVDLMAPERLETLGRVLTH